MNQAPKQPLFRQEALNNRLNRSLGTVSINVPFQYRLVSYFAAATLLFFFIFILLAPITEKIKVTGYLDADRGIINLYPRAQGIIIKSYAKEGSTVAKGTTLFLLHTGEKDKTKALLTNINQRLTNLKKTYQLKEKQYKALHILYKKHYSSINLINSTRAELLSIQDKIKLVDMERLRAKQSQYQIIKAPSPGIITNILFKPGQTVTTVKPLLQIIPKNSPLIARLYIPANNLSFVNKKTPIAIQYDAYPAKWFGVHNAAIQEINLAVLTDEQDNKPLKIGQPYYQLKASLEKAYIPQDEKKIPLRYGMTLTATLHSQPKKIWQWMLYPLYNYYQEALS